MFRKILIAEDRDIMNAGVSQALAQLPKAECIHARYCDEAYLKIRVAISAGEPFDVLISDLSFIPDGKDHTLTSGEELIAAVKKIQPEIKVIVFSIEERAFRVKSLFENLHISGYVSKGRHGIAELKAAITAVYESGEKFLSAELAHVRNDKSINEIDNYDIELLKLLAKGMTQDQISAQFKESGIGPNSVSTVEKRINKLKINFRANNSIQIVVKAIELGILNPIN